MAKGFVHCWLRFAVPSGRVLTTLCVDVGAAIVGGTSRFRTFSGGLRNGRFVACSFCGATTPFAVFGFYLLLDYLALRRAIEEGKNHETYHENDYEERCHYRHGDSPFSFVQHAALFSFRVLFCREILVFDNTTMPSRVTRRPGEKLVVFQKRRGDVGGEGDFDDHQFRRNRVTR